MDDALAKILDPNWKPTTKVWSSVDTPWGRRVYQRNDVHWDFVRPDGLVTNSEAALLGYAPFATKFEGAGGDSCASSIQQRSWRFSY